MNLLVDGTPSPPDAVREQWRATSLESVWLFADDWYHPAVDAIVEALSADVSTLAGCERLGMARAASGSGITETIDDLTCLFTSLGLPVDPAALRALCTGWASGQSLPLEHQTCVDAETGLHTLAYLEARLAEVYGAEHRRGAPPAQTHVLVVIDVGLERLPSWQRIAMSAGMGHALTHAFGEGHPMAPLGGGLFVVLLERDELTDHGLEQADDLTPALDDLRILVQQDAEYLRIPARLRRPPRTWLVTLPGTVADAKRQLTHLLR